MPTSNEKKGLPSCRLNFDKKNKCFIINTLGIDDYLNYIDNDIIFVENEIQESKKSIANNYIKNNNKESKNNSNKEKENIQSKKAFNFPMNPRKEQSPK